MSTGGRVAVAMGSVLHTFAGELCWRYDLEARRPLGGARPISREFPGVFPSGVCAAFADDSGRLCFFRGPDHVVVDPSSGGVERGLFRAGSGWNAAFVGGVDAALWCGSNDVRLFKGDRCVRFDPSVRRFVAGDPQPIAATWTNMPFDRIDSALRIGDEVVFVRASVAAVYLGRTALGVRPVTELFPGLEPWTGAVPSPESHWSSGAGYSHLGACGRRRANVESRPRRRKPRGLI